MKRWVLVYVYLVFVLGLNGCSKSSPRLNPPQPGPSRTPDNAFLVPRPSSPPADERSLALQVRAASCKPLDKAQSFRIQPPRSTGTTSGTTNQPLSFQARDLFTRLDAACQSCHSPRVAVGGFRYANSYRDRTEVIDGVDTLIPGYASAADKLLAALASGTMPPAVENESRDQYIQMTEQLQQWISAGKPDPADSSAAAEYPAVWGLSDPSAFTSLGDCSPASLKPDGDKDAYFASMETLPKTLKETDLNTLDDWQLAQRGTIAYDVEYPLMNDYAKKLRHIRLPGKADENGKFQPNAEFQAITLLADKNLSTQEYAIPENTRFYKTFFAQRRNAEGIVTYRPMETRIIVVRYGREPLYGTYVWSPDQSEAVLLDAPYRDGTPWKDLVIKDSFDETRSGVERKYVVPAKHRCVQCHQGTSQKSFVLGFNPYQLNIQTVDHLGNPIKVTSEKATQMDRLSQLGVLDPAAASLRPTLRDLSRNEERFAAHRTETWDFALDAQGYFAGNCAHCHNPNGYAYKEGQIRFDLRPGFATEFPTHLQPTKFSNDNFRIVSAAGDLDLSYLFRKVAGTDEELRGQDRMPLHTPGAPDCQVVNTISRWILSYNRSLSRQAVLDTKVVRPCTTESDFNRADPPWFEEDPTESDKNYIPRRADWNDPEHGMPARFRDLQFSPGLKDLSRQSFPTGWWINVDNACRFPEPANAADELRKWDELGQSWIRSGVESTRVPRTLGQLYTSTPGAYFFGQTCVKCHGRMGRGDGVIAKDFKQIQPASFLNGMFGQAGLNKQAFDAVDANGQKTNLTAQYFVWMAVEGTRLRDVPPAAIDVVGRYGGRMLGQIRDNCIRLLTGEKASSRDFLLYKDVCTFENLGLNDEQLAVDENGVPRNPAAVEAWADKGALNAGFLIYDYVESMLAQGKFKPSQGECSLVPEYSP